MGVWLSFGMRKNALLFSDLVSVQENKSDPIIRLVFSGILTMIFGLMLHKGILEVKMGAISTSTISNDPSVAFLIGVFSGISEKALPSKISDQAGKLFKTS